ncbi:undecaprenyl/decaprenyl-phosphate alpha-N-acetylglucosaminyl 1-phosphate transferase [Candidatus Daviesbacteria bacterium]|nr:undecaprenyl/decaprenyl-phosphate alpha-N-acetylglucosaminyl 1-phosphate transferase [Candidatus Daviesbacteria bacterium]
MFDISFFIQLLIPAFMAFMLTLLAIPITIKLAYKYKLVDDPNLRPHPAHLHKKIIPRAGGLPIFLAIFISSLLFLPLEKQLLGILLGASLLLVVGLVDDRILNFNPYLRLSLLFIAAFIAVSFGVGISFITNPFFNLNIPFLPWKEAVIPFEQIKFFDEIGFSSAYIFAFLLIVSLTQVINFSKGVDGQMPGLTLVTSLTLGLLSLKLFFAGDPNQLNLAKLSFILAGGSLGFLIFNWHPAKILPGFSASTILAFMLANLAILSGAKVATTLLVLAIPAIDFSYTILRRILSGRSPVWGDRGHLHHKLLDMGWSHTQISLFYISVSAILGTVALFVDTQSKFFGGLVVMLIFVIFILWINSFGGLSKRSDPDNG